MKCSTEAFADLDKLLKKFKNMGSNTERFSNREECSLSAFKQIYDEK